MNKIQNLLKERILVLDGAMGTMVQKYALQESDFRGERFVEHPVPPGEISITSDMQMTPPLWQKVKRN